MQPTTARLGAWAAAGLTALWLPLLAAMAGSVIVSPGIEWWGLNCCQTASALAGLNLLHTALALSLLAIPLLLAVMACLHELAPPSRRVWTRLGLLFAGVDAAQRSLVYYVQLTSVRSGILSANTEGLAPFAYQVDGSALFAVDILSLSFFGLSWLVVAPAFEPGKLGRALQWLFIANGLLNLIGLVGHVGAYNGMLMLVGLLGGVLPLPATALLGLWFRRRLTMTAPPSTQRVHGSANVAILRSEL